MVVSRFLVRFPFQFHNAISGLTSGAEFDFGRYRGRIQNSGGRWLILVVGEFDSVAEARQFVPVIWRVLAQVAFDHMGGLRTCYSGAGESVAVHNAMGLLAEVDGTTPCITPASHGALSLSFIGPSKAEVHTPCELVVRHLAFAAAQPHLNVVDGALQTAFDLHSEYAFAAACRLRLVLAVTGLEVLAERRRRSSAVQGVLDAALSTVDTMPLSDSETQADLADLRNDLLRLRGRSITRSVRSMVRDTHAELPDPDREVKVDAVMHAYDLRSKMVHQGNVSEHEIGLAAGVAYEALSAAIRARMTPL